MVSAGQLLHTRRNTAHMTAPRLPPHPYSHPHPHAPNRIQLPVPMSCEQDGAYPWPTHHVAEREVGFCSHLVRCFPVFQHLPHAQSTHRLEAWGTHKRMPVHA